MDDNQWLGVHTEDGQPTARGSVHPGCACGRAHCDLQGQTPAGISGT